MAKFKIGKNWKQNAEKILIDTPDKEKIIRTLFAVLNQIEKNDWRGACHATCSVIFVVLSEQGVKSNLILGEAKIDPAYFNHSWIEINGEIYDLAIGHPLDGGVSYPPTIKGCNIDNTNPTEIEYGVDSGFDDDEPTKIIKSMPLTAYMDSFPLDPTLGLWVAVLDAAHQIGLKLDVVKLRKKYNDVYWKTR